MTFFSNNDFESLEHFVDGSQRKVYRLADVADKIEKVAFDVVRFKDSDKLDHLWRVESTDDGPVLVAMFDEEEEQLESLGSWQAVTDRVNNVNVFYKGEAIVRFSASDMGIPEDETSIVCRYLPEKLASESEFVSSLLDELGTDERESLFKKYPELKGQE